MSNDHETEVREVVSDDPSLSPEANRILTREAREAVGAERVRVPRDTPHAERERHGEHSSIGEAFSANRILIAITFFGLLVVGAIASLATDSWWAVVVAAVVHAIGTFVVLTTLVSAARQTEHVSPTATAALAEEGVTDPDALLSDLVEEYSGIESGRNEQPHDPSESPARAGAQQRSANTPAGVATEPAGTGSGVERLMPQWVVAALMVVAVVVGRAVATARHALSPCARHRPAPGSDLVAPAAERRPRVAPQPNALARHRGVHRDRRGRVRGAHGLGRRRDVAASAVSAAICAAASSR